MLAEKQGFEPWLGIHPLSVFETDPFSRLGTSPTAIMIRKKPILGNLFFIAIRKRLSARGCVMICAMKFFCFETLSAVLAEMLLDFDFRTLFFFGITVLLLGAIIALVVSWILFRKSDGDYFRGMSPEVNTVRICRIESGKNRVTYFDLSDLSSQKQCTLKEFYGSFPGNEPERVKNWVEDILSDKKPSDYLQTSVYFHASKRRMNAFLHIRKSDPTRGLIHLETYLLPEKRSKASIGSTIRLSSERDFSESLRSFSGGNGVTFCFSVVQGGYPKGTKRKDKLGQGISFRFRMALEPFVKGNMKLIQASENEFLIASFEQTDTAEAIAFALTAVHAIERELSPFKTNKHPLDVRVGIVQNKDLMGDGDAIISGARRTAKNAFDTASSIAFFKRGTEDYSVSQITQYRSEVERIIYEKRILYSFRPVYSISRKRVIGFLGKATPRSDCAFDSIDELKNYALRAKDDKNLFAAIAKNLVGTFVSERELKSQKLYFPARTSELPIIPSFFKRLRGSKDANLVFVLSNDEVASAVASMGFDAFLESVKAVKECDYGIAFLVRGKTLNIESRLLSEADSFFVDFSMSEDTGIDTGIRSQLHALVEKLLKYRKPIIGSNLSNWNALELVVGSGIEYISSDVFAPYSPALTPVNEKNETRILALKGKL